MEKNKLIFIIYGQSRYIHFAYLTPNFLMDILQKKIFYIMFLQNTLHFPSLFVANLFQSLSTFFFVLFFCSRRQ